MQAFSAEGAQDLLEEAVFALVEKGFKLVALQYKKILSAFSKVKAAVIQPRKILEQSSDNFLSLFFIPLAFIKSVCDVMYQSALADNLFIDIFVVDQFAEVVQKTHQLHNVIVSREWRFVDHLREDVNVFEETFCDYGLESWWVVREDEAVVGVLFEVGLAWGEQ